MLSTKNQNFLESSPAGLPVSLTVTLILQFPTFISEGLKFTKIEPSKLVVTFTFVLLESKNQGKLELKVKLFISSISLAFI